VSFLSTPHKGNNVSDLYDVSGRPFSYFRDACRFALSRARTEGYPVTVRRQPDGAEMVTYYPDPYPYPVVRTQVYR
jgi:hypothetical protein